MYVTYTQDSSLLISPEYSSTRCAGRTVMLLVIVGSNTIVWPFKSAAASNFFLFPIDYTSVNLIGLLSFYLLISINHIDDDIVLFSETNLWHSGTKSEAS